MITQEQKEKYEFQQTESGQKILEMLDGMKSQYSKKLGVPVRRMKTGRLTALVNGHTGGIDRFIEE